MIGPSPASCEASASAACFKLRISGIPSKMTSQRGNAAAASCRGTIVIALGDCGHKFCREQIDA